MSFTQSTAEDDTSLHGRLVRWVENAEIQSATGRDRSKLCRRYYLADQWTEEERATLRARKQPDTVFNKVRAKIDGTRGMEMRTRTDPKAFPRTPGKEATAEAATQGLRYMADSSGLDQVRSLGADTYLVEGLAAAEMHLVPLPNGGAKPKLVHVPWDRVFFDPHSRRLDFGDARYVGLILWMDRDDAEAMFPEGADAIAETLSHGSSGQGYDDTPAFSWCDNRRERLRIVQIQWRDGGEWKRATMTRGGFLSQPEPSWCFDNEGQSRPTLYLRACYRDQENHPQGIVVDLIGPQDEENKRRSKLLHMLSVRQVVADEGAVENVDEARRELARPDGWIKKNPGTELNLLDASALAMGHFNLLNHADAAMGSMGMNASLQGKDQKSLSGVALQAQQAGGQLELEPIFDGLRAWIKDIYDGAWQCMRRYLPPDFWVRITDDLGTVDWVGLNRHVKLKEDLAAMEPAQRAAEMQRLMLVPGDPRLEQVVRIENDISDLDVDITIEHGPNVPTQQAEEFAALAQLFDRRVPLPPEALIEASSLRNKGKYIKQMQAAQQAAAQAAGMKAQADTRATTAQAMANEAKAVKTMAETEKMATESPHVAVGPMGAAAMPAGEAEHMRMQAQRERGAA